AAIAAPPWARPAPGDEAKAAWVAFTKRSAMLVVAIEHEVGMVGLPTTQFSRSRTSTQRKLPSLRGMSLGRLLKRPVTTLLMAVASDWLSPAGTQSRLSRRS